MKKDKPLIAIDLVPVVQGQGGSGGGVWTYAASLVKKLDKIDDKSCQFVVFVNNYFRIKLKNIKIIQFSFFRKNSFFHLLWVHIVLPIICYKYKINILHRVSTEAPLFFKTKLIITVHDFMTEHYHENRKYVSDFGFIQKIKTKYFLLIGKHAINKSKTILCPTESIKREITDRFNIDKRKIRYIYYGYGANNRNINIIKKKGKPKQQELLYVAGFFPHKNHLTAIRSFEYLLNYFHFEKGLEPILVFRGQKKDNLYYAKIKSFALNNKFKDNIIFRDYESDLTQEDIFKNASVVLLLSLYEGFGLPLIEAQSFGLPVVCSDIEVFRELMKDSAVFVDLDNKAEIASGIYSILQNKSFADDLIQKGIFNIKRFDWASTAKETTEAYKLLIQ